ncbi:MAG: ABC transporter permease [Spirochaetales bacterium]|jgi:ribose/xylose/arabinose/galactoside ABC-type transport system permease subunit|nr:ABC transporter permease [Spirochaetales bacterium]
MPEEKSFGAALKNIKKFQKPGILLVFVAILTVIAPNSFPTSRNISNVLWSVSAIGIMSAGSIFVILLGGIDLSLGSVMAFTGALAVSIIRLSNYSTAGAFFGILAALLTGAAVGLFHGAVITRFKVPAFLVTFATQIMLSGAARLLLDNKILSCLEPPLFTAIGMKKIFGFPLPIYIMIMAAAVSYFVLNKTPFGRGVYATGGNPVAAKLSGINTQAVTVTGYIISGFTAAIGGIVLASMTQQAMASAGAGYETEVITAIVIGGASLMGGEGNVTGAIFGAVLVGLLNNGLNLMNVPAAVHPLAKGMVIIAAVAADTLGRQGKGLAFIWRKNIKAAGWPKA